jgi:hypothetical protein
MTAVAMPAYETSRPDSTGNQQCRNVACHATIVLSVPHADTTVQLSCPKHLNATPGNPAMLWSLQTGRHATCTSASHLRALDQQPLGPSSSHLQLMDDIERPLCSCCDCSSMRHTVWLAQQNRVGACLGTVLHLMHLR